MKIIAIIGIACFVWGAIFSAAILNNVSVNQGIQDVTGPTIAEPPPHIYLKLLRPPPAHDWYEWYKSHPNQNYTEGQIKLIIASWPTAND